MEEVDKGCMMMRPSVLWRCSLGSRKGIRPVKKWVVGCWRGCLELGADLHMAQLMPLPLTVSCFIKIQIGVTFLVLAHLGSPGQRAVKWVWWWGRTGLSSISAIRRLGFLILNFLTAGALETCSASSCQLLWKSMMLKRYHNFSVFFIHKIDDHFNMAWLCQSYIAG